MVEGKHNHIMIDEVADVEDFEHTFHSYYNNNFRRVLV